MKDSLILGMLAGMAIGAVLAHTCEPVQKAVEKGKAELKKQVEGIKYTFRNFGNSVIIL